jgi:hypothetical protein
MPDKETKDADKDTDDNKDENEEVIEEVTRAKEKEEKPTEVVTTTPGASKTVITKTGMLGLAMVLIGYGLEEIIAALSANNIGKLLVGAIFMCVGFIVIAVYNYVKKFDPVKASQMDQYADWVIDQYNGLPPAWKKSIEDIFVSKTEAAGKWVNDQLAKGGKIDMKALEKIDPAVKALAIEILKVVSNIATKPTTEDLPVP